jgi:hypothetical protein
MMKPEDLDRRFKLTASIDWIRLEFSKTSKVTKRSLGASHMKSISGRTEIRVQDPKSLKQLGAKTAQCGITDAIVTGIEISLDASPRAAADREHLPWVCATMLHGMKQCAGNARVFRPGHAMSVAYTRRDALTYFREGATFYLGHKERQDQTENGKQQRLYVKTTDNKTVLQTTEHRARLETTYSLLGQPIALAEFELKRVIDTDDFMFRVLPDDLPVITRMASSTALHVLERRARATRRGPRMFMPDSRANAPLNKAVRDTLRRLCDRWDFQNLTRVSGSLSYERVRHQLLNSLPPTEEVNDRFCATPPADRSSGSPEDQDHRAFLQSLDELNLNRQDKIEEQEDLVKTLKTKTCKDFKSPAGSLPYFSTFFAPNGLKTSRVEVKVLEASRSSTGHREKYFSTSRFSTLDRHLPLSRCVFPAGLKFFSGCNLFFSSP